VTISHFKTMQLLQNFSLVHGFILAEGADDSNVGVSGTKGFG